MYADAYIYFERASFDCFHNRHKYQSQIAITAIRIASPCPTCNIRKLAIRSQTYRVGVQWATLPDLPATRLADYNNTVQCNAQMKQEKKRSAFIVISLNYDV